jgi:hypothetical protein
MSSRTKIFKKEGEQWFAGFDHRWSVSFVSKACVTNPNAAGRFLVAGGFTGLPLIFPHRTGAVQNQLGRNAPHMSPFGCRPATFVAQPGMGTTSRAAAVVHQYGHFRRPDGFRFSQLSLAGAWMLAVPTIYAAARSPHGTTSDCPIPQSSSAKKVVRHCEFSEKFEMLEKHHVLNDATENAWFLSNLTCLLGNGP